MRDYPVIQAAVVTVCCLALFFFSTISILLRSRWRRMHLMCKARAEKFPVAVKEEAGDPQRIINESVRRHRFELPPPMVARDVFGLLSCPSQEGSSPRVEYEDVQAVAAQVGQLLTAICRQRWHGPQSRQTLTFLDCKEMLLEQVPDLGEDKWKQFVNVWQTLRYGPGEVAHDDFFSFQKTYQSLRIALDQHAVCQKGKERAFHANG
eukprot:GGOE01018238.1.p2 GENE.GGOE01018238.1~~GGOE01018238.1.p2  ORF type:complete len:207 (+),score=42.41 GGOE01018238.1:130-750(+)